MRLTTNWELELEMIAMAARKRAPPTPIGEDDPDVFWDVEALVQRGIVRGWSDLWTKQKDYGFPKGVILAGKRRVFRVVDVRAWVKDREEAAVIYHPRGRPKKAV